MAHRAEFDSPYEEVYVFHYPGEQPCECGQRNHDPVTKLCKGCDPVLYRVVGYPDQFFTDTSVSAIVRMVASRKLAETIREVIAQTGRNVEVDVVE